MADDPVALSWLPVLPDWTAALAAVPMDAAPSTWHELVRLARAKIGLAESLRLDRAVGKRFSPAQAREAGQRTIRLAVLGSATVDHLLPGIRLGALRRGISLSCYTGAYGQYMAELADHRSGLHQFAPDAILFAFEAAHFLGVDHRFAPADSIDDRAEAAFDRLRAAWQTAAGAFGCRIIQQTFLPSALPALGENEHRNPGSIASLIARLNWHLRTHPEASRIDLLSIDKQVERDGIESWCDEALWFRAKQEVTPAAAFRYGELVGRILAAQLGLSSKCLVLDLDNTIWGGVIGDDGLSGITLGQGSALGEAFVAMQRYCQALARRGIVLSVCSKNDEAAARRPFSEHPEMVLRDSDIACFVANWDDKPHNLRKIAQSLSLGLESMVFVDDNPFERDLVRKELPMVAVPELPDDPSYYPRCLAAAGYFEATYLTDGDLQRSAQYQQNLRRSESVDSATNVKDYLKGLEMRLFWSPFDEVGLPRIVQLINKTNQFNLRTRRYSAAEIGQVMHDPSAIHLQMRLVDRFGDNGVIAIIIGHLTESSELFLDTWLMSCRVLGRTVEASALNILARCARARGVKRIIGEYLPSERNGMVAEHFPTLGFSALGSEDSAAGQKRWFLEMESYLPRENCILPEPAL